MRTLASLASVVCLLLYAIGVSAHHSFVTHYDYDKEITVTGVMTEIRIASPHSFFTVEVTVEDGSIETWEIEGNAVPLLARAGITADTFSVGRDGDRYGYAQSGFESEADVRNACGEIKW